MFTRTTLLSYCTKSEERGGLYVNQWQTYMKVEIGESLTPHDGTLDNYWLTQWGTPHTTSSTLCMVKVSGFKITR